MNMPTFSGTSEQQQLANEIFEIMKMQGTFFASSTPIRQTLTNLVDFFAQKQSCSRDAIQTDIDIALRENSQIFTRQEENGEVIYITSRQGYYQPLINDTSHTFKQRFYEPENPLPIDDISVVVSTSRPVLTSVEPVFISNYWHEQAEYANVPSSHIAKGVIEHDKDIVSPQLTHDIVAHDESNTFDDITDMSDTDTTQERETIDTATPRVIDDSVVDTTDGVYASDEDDSDYDDATPTTRATTFDVTSHDVPLYDATPTITDDQNIIADNIHDTTTDDEDATGNDGAVALKPHVTTHTTTEEAPVARDDMLIALPDGTIINLSKSTNAIIEEHGELLETLLLQQIEEDPLRRIVHFGRCCYPETGVVSMGKNDLRRIRDYITEEGEPLLDTDIIANLYYHNPRNADYEGFRFSLNYRLNREKDFEFVGIEGARLWSTKGLSVVGTKRVKISEMGQMTTYLTENFDDSLELQSIESIQKNGSISRLISFFEWEYGIIPLEQSLAALLPSPILPEQRSAILRVESPQHFNHFLVEMRFPLGNRGGWLQGFHEFFQEHVVPGAMITIATTDEPHIFTIVYEETTAVTDRLLTLDEKKNKFAFADVTYYCVVDEDLLITQQRYGRLKNLKSLPMNDRRKSDLVLRTVFETMGDKIGTKEEPCYRMALHDLYVTYNVLRPASLSYLHWLLQEDEDCEQDPEVPNAYLFRPEPEVEEEIEEEEDIEEDIPLVGGRRWSYGDDD